MRTMVTGANGYLGRHIVALLQDSDLEVIQVVRQSAVGQHSCDLTNVDNINELIKKTQPDRVIHCAAFVPKLLSEYKSIELSLQNSTMLSNLLAVTECPIIYISSMTVYGESEKILRAESDAGNPQSAYAQSKYDGELVLKNSGRDSVAVRIPGLFGGGRDTGLVANTLKSAAGDSLLSLPDKPLIWAAMDVEDAAATIVKITHSSISGFIPINAAYEEVYSINRFVKICGELLEKDIKCAIQHPDFEFDLTVVKSLGCAPVGDLKSALGKLKRTIL